jgi:MFS transporter, MHS family, proline/betaine transporter
MRYPSFNVNYARRTALSGAIGSVMEWYDFAIFVYLAPVISSVFFPSKDSLGSLTATYAIFAFGFISRPFGAIVYGHIGDCMGRKPVLILSVAMMGGATFCVGLLPTFDQLGPTAVIALIILRIFQGFSVGGEFPGSTAFIIELSPPKRRGFFGSWIVSGSGIGFLIGSASAVSTAYILGPEDLADWGWRIPFLGGGAIAIIAYYFRSGIDEKRPDGVAAKENGSPLLVAFKEHWLDMLRVGGLALTVNTGFYLMFVYAITFLTNSVHLPSTSVMGINTLCLFAIAVFPLGFSVLSDKIGRKPILLFGTISILLFSWPLFWLLDHQNLYFVFLGLFGFAVIFSMIFSVNPAVMAEILPHKIRISTLSVAYNLTLTLFGGTAPLVALFLVTWTESVFSPVYYLMGLAIVSLLTILLLPETGGRKLRD